MPRRKLVFQRLAENTIAAQRQGVIIPQASKDDCTPLQQSGLDIAKRHVESPPMTPSVDRRFDPRAFRKTEVFRCTHEPQTLLQQLRAESIVLVEDWEGQPADVRRQIESSLDVHELLDNLIHCGLLTEYQADRVLGGQLFGLVLGNYRVLKKIGAGGMGVVYLAEHIELRRKTAVKVQPSNLQDQPDLLRRFVSEMRAVANMQHPNIVAGIDSGTCVDRDGVASAIHYFVMEYVPGQDLEELIRKRGPLSVVEACDIAYQVGCALAEANRHGLVHRDVKPSNIRTTPEGHAKLLDFGLACHWNARMTEPGMVLGSLEFMAPEQAFDSTAVDVRADIYSLGATLFWLLTGRVPFESTGNIATDLARRVSQSPPSLQSFRPEAPSELDAVVMKMMATNPAERFSNPKSVAHALARFLTPNSPDSKSVRLRPTDGSSMGAPLDDREHSDVRHSILVVDDDPQIRKLCLAAMRPIQALCDEATDGVHALAALAEKPYDLVVLDVDMPGMSGPDLCARLRREPPCPHLKILIMSGRATADEMSRIMLAGADDYLAKPFGILQIQARVRAALKLKAAQDRSDALAFNLTAANRELEHSLTSSRTDMVEARNALILSLAQLVERRAGESERHVLRFQRYCRCLAEEAARRRTFADQIDAAFVELLECCAPLHDVGKAGLPDHIVLKPGLYTAEERIEMQTHTTIGAEALAKVAERHALARPFLGMAIDVARSHHERYDGTGYPDALVGEAIPLSARIAAVADVYDALRTRRSYKPALSHAAAVGILTGHENRDRFDPRLVRVFKEIAPHFDRIYSNLAD